MSTIVRLAVSAWLCWAPIVSATTYWDMPTAYPAGNFHTENLQKMVEEVSVATNGGLVIKLHPGGSLFKATEIKKAVESGKAPIGEVLMSNLSGENIIFNVDAIPFLATSYDDAYRLWRASKPVMTRVLDKQGVELLYAVPWPPQGIYVNRAIGSAADMKGLKWRAYNRTTTRMGELFGAKPVSVAAAELPKALAAGQVDAFLSSSATGVDVKVWQHLSHFYTVNAWVPKNMVIVNKKALEALEPAHRAALLKALENAERRGWRVSEEKNKGYLATLAQHDVRVGTPPVQWRADLNRIGRTLIAEWLQQAVTLSNDDGKIIFSNYLRGVADGR